MRTAIYFVVLTLIAFQFPQVQGFSMRKAFKNLLENNENLYKISEFFGGRKKRNTDNRNNTIGMEFFEKQINNTNTKSGENLIRL